MLVFLVVLVVFIAVGIGALAMRNRTERGIESGISSFRRELDALAPRGEPKARPVPGSPSRGADEDDDDPESGGGRTVQIGQTGPHKLVPPVAPGVEPAPREPDEPDAADEEPDDGA